MDVILKYVNTMHQTSDYCNTNIVCSITIDVYISVDLHHLWKSNIHINMSMQIGAWCCIKFDDISQWNSIDKMKMH